MGYELALDQTMLLVLFILIFSGYPVAFVLAGTAVVVGAIAVGLGQMPLEFFGLMPQRIFGIMSNQILLAVPFFILMGTVLEKSRLAEDLLKTIGQLFGSCRGGLAMAVVLVGALLAAATGVVGASVVAMGLISLPVMLKYDYNKPFAAGVITASGTLGQIIPPSIVLVVLGDQMGVSVGDLFAGALIPGLMLALFYALYVGAVSFIKPKHAPVLPENERADNRAELLKRVVFVMLPPLLLIVIVLGSILSGMATPTEAGALGAVGALILVFANGRFSNEVLSDSLTETTRITTMVIFLLIGATAFTLVFRGLDGDLWIQNLLTDLPGGTWGIIIAAGIAIFVLGFFIDFFEIVFIVIPLLMPAAIASGIDPVWFGVFVAMVLQTSFLTPPFGFSLFYLRGVAPPELRTGEIYKGVVPFLIIQIIAVVIICLFPEITKLISL